MVFKLSDKLFSNNPDIHGTKKNIFEIYLTTQNNA